jgi:hypothetical protein
LVSSHSYFMPALYSTPDQEKNCVLVTPAVESLSRPQLNLLTETAMLEPSGQRSKRLSQ